MLVRIHFFPGLCLLALGLGLLVQIARLLLQRNLRPGAVFFGSVVSSALLVLGYLLEFQRIARHFSLWWSTWLECAAIVELMCFIGLCLALLIWRGAANFHPARRRFLEAAGAGVSIAPIAATAFGILSPDSFQLSDVDVPIANLPHDLDGLRIVQISDIHLSPFLSEREFSRAIDMANQTRAHLALVTGDLISRPGDPVDACLRQLARLRADAGVLGCLGNHEVYAGIENYVANQSRQVGIQFLRGEARMLRFGAAQINFAGVDYQRFGAPYLTDAGRLIAPGAINILLSHNPDVFPVAAARGFHLTIAGHTHGGQVDFEILHQHLSVARVYTPYVRGLYRKEKSFVYVSAGLGTIGVPVRIGAAPEISLIRLCAI
jgi:predicted MPP superfamily phosphohydrolase